MTRRRNLTDADIAERERDERWAVPAFVLPPRARRGGFVYFARCLHGEGFIKIGITKDLTNRIGSLRNGCPYPIYYSAFFWTAWPKRFEEELHARFASARLGLRSEWFRPDPDLVTLAADVASAHVRAIADLLAGVA